MVREIGVGEFAADNVGVVGEGGDGCGEEGERVGDEGVVVTTNEELFFWFFLKGRGGRGRMVLGRCG